jgi:hypothetical protein
MSRTWRWVTAIVATAACIALALVVILVVVPGRDANTIHDAAALPARIQVCGRMWTMDTSQRHYSLDQARATKSSGGPSIVATGPFAPCPPRPCTDVAARVPCDTVVFVRVGQDAYVDYALSGGP